MLTALIFIFVIGVLVLVHELGHFIMARRSGMKVEEFGLGFPPRLFGIKRGDTVYSINLIPFGGFVKILGEDGQDKDNPQSFASKKAGLRAKVIVAGVVMNFLLAIIILGIGNLIGLRVALTQETDNAKEKIVQIIQIANNSPAQKAGLKPFDEIIELSNGKKVLVSKITDVQNFIENHKGERITISVKRNGKLVNFSIVPRIKHPADEGAIGISLASTGIIKYPWYKAIYKGVEQVGLITSATIIAYLTIFKNLIITGKAGIALSGPVGIAVFAGQAARAGIIYLLQLMAIISINLAIINIIPFPALDGGRLLFIGLEKIRGKPVSQKIEGLVNFLGFAFLITLMVYVTVQDIARFF